MKRKDMSSNFGTNADLKLDKINPILKMELERINQNLGLDFQYEIDKLRLTPEKGYTARADVSIKGTDRKLVAVILTPGDGTGDRQHYQNYPHLDACWTPRKKDGIEAEAYFSIGTGYNDNWFSGLTSLSAVSLLNPGNPVFPIREYKRLTTDKLDFLQGLGNRVEQEKMRRLSLVMNRQENLGDPHAVIFDARLTFPNITGYSNFFQIGAFLSFKDKCPELDLLKEKHAKHLDNLVRRYSINHKP